MSCRGLKIKPRHLSEKNYVILVMISTNNHIYARSTTICIMLMNHACQKPNTQKLLLTFHYYSVYISNLLLSRGWNLAGIQRADCWHVSGAPKKVNTPARYTPDTLSDSPLLLHPCHTLVGHVVILFSVQSSIYMINLIKNLLLLGMLFRFENAILIL